MARLIVGFVEAFAAFVDGAGVDRLENALARITSPINLPLYWPSHFLPLLSLSRHPSRARSTLSLHSAAAVSVHEHRMNDSEQILMDKLEAPS